ncbi:MAG: hypothetical protein M0Z80_15510 [Treponema sp.]|nr:hypothetical protein [Treponema sp.]
MDLNGYMALSMQVLSDWRVVFVALGSIIVWSILRRVGVVYHAGPRRRPQAPSLPPKNIPRSRPRRSAPPPSQDEGDFIE